MNLKGKKILLISPQAWNKVKVSKHHYALALAERGNEVFFLNPPINGFGKRLVIDKLDEMPGLKIITFYTFFPLELRFHLRFLFDLLMRLQLRLLLKKIKLEFDIVWSFDPYLYSDLSLFGAHIKIFHPVDVFHGEAVFKTAKSADVLFSVSPSILDTFRGVNVPSYFVNHGLGKEFRQFADTRVKLGLFNADKVNSAQTVGYIGNLLIPYLDRQLFKSLISDHLDKHFLLIGPYEITQSSLGGGGAEAEEFVSFLKNQRNVTLTGPKSSGELVLLMAQCDCFIICYSGKQDGYDLSNTHKMLEYLSTGKVILSTPIKAYEQRNDIIVMPKGIPEDQFKAFFSRALDKIHVLNSKELQIERIELSLENLYELQIDRIEKYLSDLCLDGTPRG